MKNVVALPDVPDPPGVVVLASGPVTKQPETMAYRLVLAERGDGSFVVWSQVFSREAGQDGKLHHHGFISGSYFKKTEFALATARFAERLLADSKAHYASLYREAPADAA